MKFQIAERNLPGEITWQLEITCDRIRCKREKWLFYRRTKNRLFRRYELIGKVRDYYTTQIIPVADDTQMLHELGVRL